MTTRRMNLSTEQEDRVVKAAVAIHSRRKREREQARATLLALAPPRRVTGDRFDHWLLGGVEVLTVWPTAAGARGWHYIVRRTTDDAHTAPTYVASDAVDET